MKLNLISLIPLLIFNGCITKYVPVETKSETQTVYRDSVILRTDTVFIEVPIESHSRATRDTVSHLETSVAISDASVSEGVLSHFLANKEVSLEKEIVYQDRIITRDSTVYISKEVPVEVEKVKKVIPKWCWILLLINSLGVLGVVLKLWWKTYL